MDKSILDYLKERWPLLAYCGLIAFLLVVKPTIGNELVYTEGRSQPIFIKKKWFGLRKTYHQTKGSEEADNLYYKDDGKWIPISAGWDPGDYYGEQEYR